MKVKVSASLLSADFMKLAQELTEVAKAGADWLHLDIMDGHFASMITFGPPVIAKLRPHCSLPFDVHLMIDNPEKHIDDFVKAGSDIITVPAEASVHLHGVIQLIKSHNKKAGIGLNPSTSLESIRYLLDDIDMITILAVNPGFAAKEFIPAMIPKIRQLRDMVGPDKDIEVDGSISGKNALSVIKAGANILVAGSAIFGAKDYKEAVSSLKPKG